MDTRVKPSLPSLLADLHLAYYDGVPAAVRGSAEEFCLVLTRRRHVDDTALVAEGAAAGEWLEIGQAFAGRPGPGPARLAGKGGRS